jgi:hypothetical protein
MDALTSVLTEPGELHEFLQGYMDDTGGDPSEIVCQLFTPWEPDITRLRDLRPLYSRTKKLLQLHFTHVDEVLQIPISESLAPEIDGGEIQAYGLRKVCRGVWALAPSLLVPELLHCYIVFHGVPEPAPWESVIVIVPALVRI